MVTTRLEISTSITRRAILIRFFGQEDSPNLKQHFVISHLFRIEALEMDLKASNLEISSERLDLAEKDLRTVGFLSLIHI